MSKREGPTNPILRGLIRKLRRRGKERDADIWLDLAEELSRSNRARSEVNISQLNRHTDSEDMVMVPGKVLGSGKLDHSILVAAFNFSSRALERIRSAGGETLSVEELLERNPDGENVSIMK